jgi:hypothetical protein
MATADEYAAWIVANKGKKGTPEFETVAAAYRQASQESPAEKPAKQPVPSGRELFKEANAGAMNYSGGGNALGGLMAGAGSFLPDSMKSRYEGAAKDVLGADPESTAYKTTKLLGQLGLTAGIGPVLGVVAKAVGAGAPVVNALTTSGMTTGVAPVGFGAKAADVALRTGAGAAVGGASAAAVGDDAGTGAMIGGAAPGVFKAVGTAGGFVGRAAFEALTPALQKRAVELARATGKSVDEVMTALTQQGPSQLPGVQLTTPQILQDKTISQVARNLKNKGQFALDDVETMNASARRAALERVAPTYGTLADARTAVGENIENFARPAEEAARGNVKALFDSIPANEARIQLPLDNMARSAERLTGAGYVGKGKSTVGGVLNEAQRVGFPNGDFRAVPFNEIQNLRASINEAIGEAKQFGRGNAAAALTAMKNDLDNKMAAVMGGEKVAGEIFTPQAMDAYGQGLAAHAAKKTQFNTGPQASIFRQGATGEPQRQGGQIPGLFWGAGGGQVKNVEAFKRLTGNDQNLVSEMKRLATTEASETFSKNAAGEATFDKFNKWLRTHSGAARELFSDSELATLKAINDNLRTTNLAENLGRATGSNTAQNFFSQGVLDKPGVNLFASKVPFGQAALGMVKGAAEKSNSSTLAQLLASPETMAKALQDYSKRGQKSKLAELLASPEAQQLMYRMAPISQ